MRVVQKFGGTSLVDADCLRSAAEKAVSFARQGAQVVCVVSAQGQATDALLRQIAKVTESPDPREADGVLAAGEQISAGLMAMSIQSLGYPAMSFTGGQAGIRTDCNYTDARILHMDTANILRALENGKIAVVAGFQGVDETGSITTLGRGGSDTTAVALAAALGADRCMIYTDVDGVYDRDPRRFPDAKKFPVISYEDMLALAQSGAQVLQKRCVELGKRFCVPIEVLSAFHPGEGTLVTDTRKSFLPKLP